MNFRQSIFVSALALVFTTSVCAQDDKKAEFSFGLGGGYHVDKLSFSDLDEDYFPDNSSIGSGVFSVFVQGEFGSNRNFGVRPQLSFLTRGGKLSNIGKNNIDYETEGVEDINYTLKSSFVDFRVPLIYNFGRATSKVRPYVFVAPVLSFSNSGFVSLVQENADNSMLGYKTDISKANMSSTNFAGQIGAGVKFAIPVADDRCYLGIEASYELGFTDTYGKKEKDGEANDLAGLFNHNYKIDGTRKMSGFEFGAVLYVPFSVFKSKQPAPPAPVEAPVVVEKKVEEVKEKPCYTLEEINDLIVRNQLVDGKTICAVDAINFEFSKSTISEESYDYLDRLAATLIKINRNVEVKGHTDNVGSEKFNLKLSRERAEAVVKYLVKKGVNKKKLTYSYYGMSRPLSDNDTEEGRAMNRRVEFTILNY